jgi:hypothetical protein
MRKKLLGVLLAGIYGISTAMISPEAFAVNEDIYPAGDERAGILAMGADFILVRPLTFALTVVGGVFWFITLPVSAIGGNVAEAGDKLFLEPGRYTFVRPLGHLELDDSPILDDRESTIADR